MTSKLDNSLRAYRKGAGLSQGEVAYLGGCRSGTRVPSLEAALA